MTAAQTTFDTYELLENILLHLPVLDLLLSQRVCQTWRQLIQRSENIQKALFLQPCSDERMMPLVTDAEIQQHKLANELLHRNTGVKHHASLGWYDGKSKKEIMRPVCNPLLLKRLYMINSDQQVLLNAILNRAMIDALHRPDASWKKMSLLQPPAEEVRIEAQGQGFSVFTTTKTRVRASSRKVVTLCDILEKTGPVCPKRSFREYGARSYVAEHGTKDQTWRSTWRLEGMESGMVTVLDKHVTGWEVLAELGAVRTRATAKTWCGEKIRKAERKAAHSAFERQTADESLATATWA